MKKLFLPLLALSLALATVSCTNSPDTSQPTSNPSFRADKLFVLDGCTVYRFTDAGSYIYWSDCKGRIDKLSSDYNPSTKTYDTHRQQVLNN